MLKDAALIECRLETGRTHQVRVHMASIGHPLLGDPVYGRSGKTHGKVLKELGFTGRRCMRLSSGSLIRSRRTGCRSQVPCRRTCRN